MFASAPAPASQPQLGRKHLDRNQGPDRFKGVLKMIHTGRGGPFNGNLSFHLHFGKDARVDPIITLGEIARPHCLPPPHSYDSLLSLHIKGQWLLWKHIPVPLTLIQHLLRTSTHESLSPTPPASPSKIQNPNVFLWSNRW